MEPKGVVVPETKLEVHAEQKDEKAPSNKDRFWKDYVAHRKVEDGQIALRRAKKQSDKLIPKKDIDEMKGINALLLDRRPCTFVWQ